MEAETVVKTEIWFGLVTHTHTQIVSLQEEGWWVGVH